MSRFDLDTGDLLLFDYHGGGFFGVFTGLIKYFTKSKYSHIAMVLKDPDFLHPSLKGYYVWESSWEGKPDPQDGKIKLGVQITPLNEILKLYSNTGNVFLRKLVPGGTEHSFGIQVAKMAGVPKKIIDEANDVLKHLESNHSKGVSKKKKK